MEAKVYTLQSVPEDDIGIDEGWRITDLGGLEWALERLGEALAVIAENEALGKQAAERLANRVEAINRPQERRRQYFEAAILSYAAEHRAELLGGGKKKSRDLPAGTVGWRKTGGRLRVVDEDAAIKWARESGDLGMVRVKVEVNKSALQEHYKATGEIPPGCDVEPESDEPYVKPVVPELAIGTGEPKRLESKP